MEPQTQSLAPHDSHRLTDPIRSLLESGLSHMDDLEKEVQAFTEKHPLLAVAGAIAVSAAVESLLHQAKRVSAPSPRDLVDVSIGS